MLVLKSIIFILVFLVCSIASHTPNGIKSGYTQRIELNLKSSPGGQDKLLKYSDIARLKSYFPLASVSYMGEQPAVVSAQDRGYPVSCVKSGEGLENFMGLEMAGGTFFSREQYKYGRNVAVISEEMAYKLFTVKNVIGNTIYISGTEYRVSGVYKNSESLLSLLASDGVERVYVPFKSDGSKIVNTLFIKDEKLDQDAFRVTKLEKILKEGLKINIDQYKLIDFTNSGISARQPLSAFVFCVGILSLIILARHLIKYISYGVNCIKSAMKDYYLSEIFKKWKIRILVFLIGGAAILGSMGVIIHSIKFKGYIPRELVPAENIFDVSFYASKAAAAVKEANSSRGCPPAPLELLYSNNLKIIYMLLISVIINFMAIRSGIKLERLISQGQSLKKQLTALTAAIVMGWTAAAAICLATGIRPAIPIRETILLAVYFCLDSITLENIKDLFKNAINKGIYNTETTLVQQHKINNYFPK